jgi:alkanesulfonate monooxygenase SsuD/methylene tetrahydromethanopterin reductase-like flavin-dependent oxidoreductase (luciferase family)
VFATVHVTLLTPAFAAKAIATIDHASHGRAGLNIVCGWNQDEFDIHGVSIDGDTRYDQGLEWFRIYAKMLQGGPPFDWDGDFYHLKGLVANPLPVQRPRPPIMSAGFSLKGRAFAAEAADILFTTLPDPQQAQAFVRSVHDYTAQSNRHVDVYSTTQMICRPTRREAEEFYHYFAEEMADRSAIDYFRKQRGATAGKDTPMEQRPSNAPLSQTVTRASGKQYPGLFPGTHPLVGTPDDIVAELQTLHQAGLAGSALVFLNYLEEMPYFLAEVLPRMQRLGLRAPI